MDIQTRFERLGYSKTRYGTLAHGDGKDRRYWLWSLSLYQPPFPQGGYVESFSPGWSRTSTAGRSEEPDGTTEMQRDLAKLFRAPPAFSHIRDLEDRSRSVEARAPPRLAPLHA